MSEEIRHRILAAAARVYAQYGFRGATTRLIATDAGVNEVTLFRTFGSKAQLLHAMLQSQVDSRSVPMLPSDIGDPASELTRWCASTLEYLRGHAHLIRKTIGEAEERPDAACAACEGPSSAGASLSVYLERLREEGVADPDADIATAVSMLMSTMFGDALYREIIPNAFPQPAESAPAKYVETFLRAAGVRSMATGASRRVVSGRRRAR